MTRGRAALIAILQRTRSADVAARCRVSAAAVSLWAAGRNLPSHRSRAALRDSYGIAPELWDRVVVVRL